MRNWTPPSQGSTRNKEREALFDRFRAGEIQTLVVSKVANFSIEPAGGVGGVQVSGTFGSRQRRRSGWADSCVPSTRRSGTFYSVVARDTLDAEYAAHRQRFLAEQGYAYRITDADDLLGPAIG
ncbi:hypothetical protein GS425_15915 [Rhodococcus hoagii]|nr:hypothetical protein [Prescottella equi]